MKPGIIMNLQSNHTKVFLIRLKMTYIKFDNNHMIIEYESSPYCRRKSPLQ